MKPGHIGFSGGNHDHYARCSLIVQHVLSQIWRVNVYAADKLNACRNSCQVNCTNYTAKFGRWNFPNA